MAPTDLIPAQQGAIVAVAVPFFAASIFILARAVARFRGTRGAVEAGRFDLPELLIGFVLASFLGGLVAKSALRGAALSDMTPEVVLGESITFLVIVAGLLAFLFYRRLEPVKLFGLLRLPPWKVFGWAALLLFAAFPWLGAASLFSRLFFREDLVEQPLVRLFREIVARGDASGMTRIVLAGVVLAPLCEEFLFRGFFYGVGKRYLGALPSALVTSALFAACHANLASLAGLFVLALALTLAYERTGSLLVPMTMHALFNATSLTVLYLQATHALPA